MKKEIKRIIIEFPEIMHFLKGDILEANLEIKVENKNKICREIKIEKCQKIKSK